MDLQFALELSNFMIKANVSCCCSYDTYQNRLVIGRRKAFRDFRCTMHSNDRTEPHSFIQLRRGNANYSYNITFKCF